MLSWLAFVLATAVFPGSATAGFSDGLLEPEKAFHISARALDERSVEIAFRISKGYYLYRDRLSFATESGEPLAGVEVPRGKLKDDPLFGKTETFHELVRIRVTVSPSDVARGSVALRVTSQGCADARVCYAPIEQRVEVKLPPRESR